MRLTLATGVSCDGEHLYLARSHEFVAPTFVRLRASSLRKPETFPCLSRPSKMVTAVVAVFLDVVVGEMQVQIQTHIQIHIEQPTVILIDDIH